MALVFQAHQILELLGRVCLIREDPTQCRGVLEHLLPSLLEHFLNVLFGDVVESKRLLAVVPEIWRPLD